VTSERRYLWIAVGLVAAVLVSVLVVPKFREELAPTPYGALVAVEVEGSGVARVGQIDIAAGAGFRLHAVLLAEDRRGETVYYSEAPALEVAGVVVPEERLRRWGDTGRTIALWFTAEGYRPFVAPASVGELETFHWQEAFRPDWGRGWTVVGSVTPRNRNLARVSSGERELGFGTAWYQVRIERYFRAGDPAPIGRYESPGAEALPLDAQNVTRVVSRLPDGLGSASAVFGLPHLEPPAGSERPLVRAVAGLYRQGLAFSRVLLLDRVAAASDLSWSEIEWRPIDIVERPSWEMVGPGDLLRSGERVVILYEDRGASGVLDYEDLCFDYAENAAVRSLGEVFKSGGVLDWADLGTAPSETTG
jgi:hypothetical protein